MPVEAKPLFRPNVLHRHLIAFDLPKSQPINNLPHLVLSEVVLFCHAVTRGQRKDSLSGCGRSTCSSAGT